MTAPLRFVFGLHLHQPVGNFDHVMADHVRDVYRPIIERATEAGLVPLTLHVSGPLLEWLETHDKPWLDFVGRLAADGKVEPLTAGFDEPILPSLHRPHHTESDGRRMGLLAIDERLRYLIPFRPPEETAAYLRELRAQGHGLAVLADDGEKFGGWPGTKDWVYGSGWLDTFLKTMAE